MITANTIRILNLTTAAVEVLEGVNATDATVHADVERVRSGDADGLRAECYDGADDDATAAWDEYVDALEVACTA